MVQPASTEDVATTVKTLTANKCPFGIRAGGHGSFPLSNSVKRGVTIDFGKHFAFPRWRNLPGSGINAE